MMNLKEERLLSNELLDRVIAKKIITKKSSIAIRNKINTSRRAFQQKLIIGLQDAFYLGTKITLSSINKKQETIKKTEALFRKIENRYKNLSNITISIWVLSGTGHRHRRIIDSFRGIIDEYDHYSLYKIDPKFRVKDDLIKKYKQGEYFYVTLTDEMKKAGYKDGVDLLKILYKNKWAISGDVVIYIESIEKFERPNRTKNKINLELFDDDIDKINYKYIKYSDTSDNTIGNINYNEYLQHNYILKACVYTCIIQQYYNEFKKLSLEGRYKVDLTYEYLYNRLHPDAIVKYDANLTLGCTIHTAVQFFKIFKLKLICLDINYKIIYKYIPDKVNKKISPICTYLLIHNTHSYLLNHNIKQLEQKIKTMEITDEHKAPSPNYFINDYSKKYIYVNSLEDFKKLDQTTDLTNKINDIHYPHGLNDIYLYLTNTLKYQPTIKIQNNNFTSLSYTLNSDKIINVIAFNYNEDNTDNIVDSKKEYLEYTKHEKNIYETLICKNNLSYYSESLQQALYDYPRQPLCCCFYESIDNSDTKVDAIDINKAYTSNLLDMIQIPVFNKHDSFITYIDEPIKDYTIYFIESLDSKFSIQYIMMDKKYNLISGYSLNRTKLINYKILAQCTPSKLILNKTKQSIKDIYDSTLNKINKKFIINKTIGLCGKSKNKSSLTNIYTTKEECFTDSVNNDFEYNEYRIDDDNKIYFNNLKSETILENGFYAIQFFIYDIMRLKMYKLSKTIELNKGIVHGVKTDSVYYENYDYKIKKVDSSDYSNIGKYRLEPGTNLPSKLYYYEENTNNLMVDDVSEITEIVISDEYDEDEIYNKLKDETGVFIKADLPGSGKTSIFTTFSKRNINGSDDMLFVAPTNRLCIDFKKKGFKTVTLCTLLSQRVNESDLIETNKKRYDVSDYNYIIFDEIFNYKSSELASIKNFINANPTKQYFCCGDVYQNKPIENLNNIPKSKYNDYFINIVTGIFSKYINLKISKRFTNNKDISILNNIKTDIFNSKDTFNARHICDKYFKEISDVDKIPDKTTIICYRNDNASILNNHLHKKENYPKENIIYNNNTYYNKLRLRCRTHFIIGSTTFYVNYEYLIDDITKTSFSLIDVLTEEKTTKINLIKLDNFTFCHAETGHSLQGVTVENNIIIFDTSFMYVTPEWLWTAITRCKKLSDIYYFSGLDIRKNASIIKTEIEHYVSTLIKEDIDNNISNKKCITEKNLFDIYKSNGGECRCGESINVEYRKNEIPFIVKKINNKLPYTIDNTQLCCKLC